MRCGRKLTSSLGVGLAMFARKQTGSWRMKTTVKSQARKFDKQSSNLRRQGICCWNVCWLLIDVVSGSFIAQLAVYGMAYISAFGCEPLVAPPGVWMRISNDFRSDDGERYPMATTTAVFRCNDSEEAWHLLCRGTRWIGHVGNCSTSSLYSFSWSKYTRCWTFSVLPCSFSNPS